MEHSRRPNITLVPDTWYDSLLRTEGESTLNNASDYSIFFLIFGEMRDLRIPEGTNIQSRHYILSTIFLNSQSVTKVNFPSEKVRVIVGRFKYPERREGELTVFLHRELEQAHTFNVLERHVLNEDPIRGLVTIYPSFDHLLLFLQEHHNEDETLWEIRNNND
ncbi:hypothetical protein ACTA71_008137 [Dictyostelium dimigraforme]